MVYISLDYEEFKICKRIVSNRHEAIDKFSSEFFGHEVSF
jgi:hypothetical protein